MVSRYLFIFFSLLPCLLPAQEKQISITIDDLPCTNCRSQSFQEVNDKILRTLSLNQAPATGFVNEQKLYRGGLLVKNRVAILQQWLDEGQELGNHTFSHISINTADIRAYEADIIKGEAIIRPMIEKSGGELLYFRHPQLRTGPTPEYKMQLDSILSELKYITAPVTMDNDEYIYAYCYAQAKKRGEDDKAEEIAREYIRYMEQVITYFEDLSAGFLGYPVKHILLLHANELNADHLQSVIDLLKERHYRFITLKEALTDPSYSLPEAQSTRGISWLHRWMIARGLEPEPQPGATPKIMALFNEYQN